MSEDAKQSKPLNILIWTVQLMLSLSLIIGAGIKLFLPQPQLAKMFPWTVENSALLVTTAFVDLLLGLVLILPRMAPVASKLSILAAYGIVLLMIAAGIFHISRDEASDIGVNIVYLALAVLFIWGRQIQLKHKSV